MIPLSVSEISALDTFGDELDEDEEELGILVVGYTYRIIYYILYIIHINIFWANNNSSCN